MRTILLTSMAAIFVFLAPPSYAQIVVNATSATLQPTITRDERGFKSCGVRALVIAPLGDEMKAYDFSLNVYPEALSGMVKVGAHVQARGKVATQQPPPVSFWIVEATKAIPLKPPKVTPAETEGFILGLTDFGPTLEAMGALVDGKRMQFAARYKNETVERAISFEQAMTGNDKLAFDSCVAGLKDRIDLVIKDQEQRTKK